jgi:hypothetical protein
MAADGPGRPARRPAKASKAASTEGAARAATASAKGAGAATAAGDVSPHRKFLRRVISSAKVAAYLLAATLAGGTIGYHFIAGLTWLIAFHQASLLLSGMGPVETNLSDAGRLFESFYSIFCGVMLLGSTGILFTPVIHRILHAFHVEDTGTGDK